MGSPGTITEAVEGSQGTGLLYNNQFSTPELSRLDFFSGKGVLFLQ
jgi:hypothetical protein